MCRCGLLDFIETSALSPDVEVSLAALQSLQEILNIVPDESNRAKSHSQSKKHGSIAARVVEAPAGEAPSGLVVEKVLWDNVWKVWTSIGLNATLPANTGDGAATAPANLNDVKDADDSGKASSSESSPTSASSPVITTTATKLLPNGAVYVPSQPFLTALMNIFPILFSHIKSTFEIADFNKLARVLQGALAVPVQGESAPFLVPSFTELSLTPLQVSYCFRFHSNSALCLCFGLINLPSQLISSPIFSLLKLKDRIEYSTFRADPFKTGG